MRFVCFAELNDVFGLLSLLHVLVLPRPLLALEPSCARPYLQAWIKPNIDAGNKHAKSLRTAPHLPGRVFFHRDTAWLFSFFFFLSLGVRAAG